MDAIVNILSAIAPTYPGIAETTARVPYILYTENDVPLVTIDGIAGYESTLTLAVIARSRKEATLLRDRIIKALNGVDLGDDTLYYDGATFVDYPEEKLSSFEMTFNWIR